jgi:hypothetical protein
VSSWRRLLPVQRLFSMFPPGLPGLALVLMRASVAGAVLLDIYTHKATLPGWAMGAACMLSAILCAGYLTPVASVAALIFHAILWLSVGAESTAVATITSFDALALALLGPGGYSIDSFRFGRRVVLLPPD